MPADEQIIAQEHNQPTAAPQQSAKQARSRQSDDGPEILPCMEHFVTLVRKAKRPGLALLLVERASATSLPEVAALTDVAKGTRRQAGGVGRCRCHSRRFRCRWLSGRRGADAGDALGGGSAFARLADGH